MALNIKNPEVESLATEIATLMHVSKTEAIRVALTERRARILAEQSDRAQATLDWLKKEVWPRVPENARSRLSANEVDETLGQGEDGF